MKKVSYFAVILLLALSVFNSCSDKDNDNGGDQGKVTLDVFPKELSVAAGGEGSAFIVTSNSSWTITDMPEWISLDMENGNGNAEVTVTAEANEGAARSARLTVAAGSGSDVKTATVTIEQSGITEELEISESAVTVAAYGGSVTFDITSNVAWTVSKLSSDDWITEIIPGYGSGNGQVTVVAAANTSENERSATLTVSSASENTTRTVNIMQPVAKPETDIIVGTWDFTAYCCWNQGTLRWTSQIYYEETMDMYIVETIPFSTSYFGSGAHMLFITKEDGKYFISNHNDEWTDTPVGTALYQTLERNLFQTIAGYPDKSTSSFLVIINTPVEITVTDTAIIIPEKVEVELYDGAKEERYLGIGAMIYIDATHMWLTTYGETKITRKTNN